MAVVIWLAQGHRGRFAGGAAALIGHLRQVSRAGRPRPAASTASVGDISARATSFRYHAEETARAHILKKHPGRMSASCFAALGKWRLPLGLRRTGAVALGRCLFERGGDLVTGRLPVSLAGMMGRGWARRRVMILGRPRGRQGKSSLAGVLVKGGFVVVKAGKLLLALASFAAYVLLFTWQFAVIILGMLVIHECGHLRCMKHYGMKTRGIYLIPLLGAAVVAEDDFPSRRAEATHGPGRAAHRGRAGGRGRATVLRHPQRRLRCRRRVDGIGQPVQPAAGGAAGRRPGGEVDHLLHRLADGAGRGHRGNAAGRGPQSPRTCGSSSSSSRSGWLDYLYDRHRENRAAAGGREEACAHP